MVAKIPVVGGGWWLRAMTAGGGRLGVCVKSEMSCDGGCWVPVTDCGSGRLWVGKIWKNIVNTNQVNEGKVLKLYHDAFQIVVIK